MVSLLLIYSLHCWSPHIVSSSGSWEHSQPNPKILSAHQWARVLPILFRALVTLCPPSPSSELFNVTLGFPLPRLLLHPGTQRTFGFLWPFPTPLKSGVMYHNQTAAGQHSLVPQWSPEITTILTLCLRDGCVHKNPERPPCHMAHEGEKGAPKCECPTRK